MNSNSQQQGKPAYRRRCKPDPDHPVHVDRRLRALPFGGEAPESALSRPAGRFPHLQPVRAPARLHAGGAQGHCRRPAARTAAAAAIPVAGAAPARRALRHGSGDAAHLEGGAGAVSCRHPGTHRLCRRGALFPDQRHALGRAQARAHDRLFRHARLPEGRGAAERLAAAGNRRARKRDRAMARAAGRCRATIAGSSHSHRARSVPARPGRRNTMPSSRSF